MATVSRTTPAKRDTAPGSSFVPALTTTTRGSEGPSERSAAGTSDAWRLISVEARTCQPGRKPSR